MAIELKEAKPPAYLKLAFYGDAGGGKTYTAAKVLAQFIKEYAPDLQLAMLDTEGGAGFVAPMVKELSGKPLLSFAGTSFAELREFLALSPNKYVSLIDSATHIWRTLCEDYLVAKRSRVKAAGGNIETVRLSLSDWGPIKEIWNKGFSDPYKYLAAHFCYNGRAGDVWETIKDEEGKDQLQSTGTKMKIEAQSAYEPSLLVEMIRVPNPAYAMGKSSTQWLHRAEVVKDRSGLLTGKSCDDPDIEFFRPHIEFLMGGIHAAPNANPELIFNAGTGKNWETLKREREALLAEIADDFTLAFPGQSAAAKQQRIAIARQAFGVSSFEALQDEKRFPVSVLLENRDKLKVLIAEGKEQNAKNGE